MPKLPCSVCLKEYEYRAVCMNDHEYRAALYRRIERDESFKIPRPSKRLLHMPYVAYMLFMPPEQMNVLEIGVRRMIQSKRKSSDTLDDVINPSEATIIEIANNLRVGERYFGLCADNWGAELVVRHVYERLRVGRAQLRMVMS